MTTHTTTPATITTTNASAAGRPAPRPAGRPPVAAVAAAGLSLLAVAVTSYGSVYFTGLEGYDALGLTFLVTYLSWAALGLVSAVALLTGRAVGRVGLLAYCAFMLVFTAFKLGYIHEVPAIPFGVVTLTILGLLMAPSTRRFAARAGS
jgi:hypothetical protein